MTEEEALPIVTIYESPADHPGKFVARRFFASARGVEADKEPLAVVATLEEARNAIPNREALVCMARNPGDEPQIVESWL